MKRLGLLLALFAVASLGFGQAVSVNGGSIQGTITDPSGASVPEAKISLINDNTGSGRTFTTDSAGVYSIGPLVPGNYTVKVTKQGFSTLSVKTVIRTGTATSGNFKLSIGESTTTVEVDAGAVQVNTEQFAVSDVITSEQIKTLPVNGRNFLDLAQIQPGVILQSGESFDPTKAGYSAISVSGVSGRTTRILLDGQDITDETVGTTIFNVSQGSIGEFQLNRSTQDVSGEVTSTGQVLVATNTGTNSYHGQLFYQFQDHRALFARSKDGLDPPFQRNQFGGSIGGPIIKDKLFFFGNSERIKQDSLASSTLATGPTALFSSIAAQYPFIPTPYRETYSTARLDYNGPFGGHYFVRANYNVNAVSSNYGLGYSLYANRDNTPGIAGGADYQFGKFTHSFRVSYEKFHNLISDATAGNSALYNGVPGVTVRFATQNLFSGPNYLAPQGTFQTDKQFRYDGSWTKSKHTIRYGYSFNRILGGGYAAFYGLSPYTTLSSATLLDGRVTTNNPLGYGCNNVVGGASCANDPVNGYHTNTAVIGNGQGSFTERPAFGLPGSGVGDWRQGAYITDSWKVTPSFTVTAGVRWSVDTGRANQDLNQVNCSDVDPSLNPGCSGSTSLFAQWDPSLAGKVKQNWANLGPQVGFAFSPGDHKTVVRAGFGIYYEGDPFNNTTNARSSLLKQGAFFDDKLFCRGGGSYSVVLPDGTTVSSVDGVSITQLCNSSVSFAGPYFIKLQQQYQANTKVNAQLANGGYVGNTLSMLGTGAYGAPYRTPYSEQWNGGIQRELFHGTVLSVDYIHNSTLKVGQTVDMNRVGAARYLDQAAARAAIAATTSGYNCAGGSSAAAINCAIIAGATLGDFAGNGLDSGAQYLAGNAGQYQGGAAAFPGKNPLLGQGNFIMPVGRSGYDALQIVYKQVVNNPVRGVKSMNLIGSYNLSRIVSTSDNSTGDQFFSNYSFDNDNPTRFMGRASLDHKHQVTIGGSFTVKYGPQIGIIGQFRSAAPENLRLDTTNPTGGIFTSDVTGDGTTGDIAPGTDPGDYMHRIKSDNLGKYIANFNATQANTLTPAGQALVSAGLFTQGQLTSIGATIQPIAALPQANAIKNPAFRSMDVNFSYPISLSRVREGMSLQPVIAFYNVFNMANYIASNLGTLVTQDNIGATNAQTGYITGYNSYDALNANRVQRGSGTFAQGAPRSAEFQLKLNF
jgi:hypothetical protein